MFKSIAPTTDEIRMILPGDDVVMNADVVMDRAFTINATPEAIWPWIEQLGKHRAGWYLPESIERFMPRKKRALRSIEPSYLNLTIDSVIDDWGGKQAYFKVVDVQQPLCLIYTSIRGKTSMTWAIVLSPIHTDTRIHFRLRLNPVRRKWLANSLGNYFDAITIAGLAAGLRERIQ